MPPLSDKLILRNDQCPGDILMLTAAVRDLKRAHGDRFTIGVKTRFPELWENNPYIANLSPRDRGVQTLACHYPLYKESNRRPYHFVHAFTQYLEKQLNVRIPVTEMGGDIHLSDAEKAAPPPLGKDKPYWIIAAGGKRDATVKWWNPQFYQEVVDALRDQVSFVQVGSAEDVHWHLDGVTNLVGLTTIREMVNLMYHADGCVCPITFHMHLAAAVPARPGRLGHKPCVVVAGGRESPSWVGYPGHQFLHTVGALPCCISGGCWKSRCQKVGDGDSKDTVNTCLNPIQIFDGLRIPKCMQMITPEQVAEAVRLYYRGGALAN
jgi:ADP-heptose:LPS heptosyltransferase